MIRLRPTKIRLIGVEIQEYDSRARFKPRPRECRAAGTYPDPLSPTERAILAEDAASDDIEILADEVFESHSSAMSVESNSDANADADANSTSVVEFTLPIRTRVAQDEPEDHHFGSWLHPTEVEGEGSWLGEPSDSYVESASRQEAGERPRQTRRASHRRRLTLPPPFSTTPRRMNVC